MAAYSAKPGSRHLANLCGTNGVSNPADAVPGDADNNGVADVQVVIGRRMREIGGRLADGKNDALQIAAGFRGDMGGGFDYDIYASFNRGDFAAFQTGNVSVSAYQNAVRQGRVNLFVEDGIHGAGEHAGLAVDADRRVDVELVVLVSRVNAVDGTNIDASPVFHADARFRDDVRHDLLFRLGRVGRREARRKRRTHAGLFDLDVSSLETGLAGEPHRLVQDLRSPLFYQHPLL